MSEGPSRGECGDRGTLRVAIQLGEGRQDSVRCALVLERGESADNIDPNRRVVQETQEMIRDAVDAVLDEHGECLPP